MRLGQRASLPLQDDEPFNRMMAMEAVLSFPGGFQDMSYSLKRMDEGWADRFKAIFEEARRTVMNIGASVVKVSHVAVTRHCHVTNTSLSRH